MTFAEDFEWQEQFRGHYSEIANCLLRFDVAPAEDDWHRNTDFTLRLDTALPRGSLIRISARARRRKYLGYRGQFTVRLDRPSGATTEMPKIRDGWGDAFIYGLESSEPGRLLPWMLASLAILRDYLDNGGYYGVQDNVDRSSRFAVFWLDDMPPGFLIAEAGMPLIDPFDCWGTCRKCWGYRGRGYVMPMGDGFSRECLFCGFTWRSGRYMPFERDVRTHRWWIDAHSKDTAE